MYKYCLLIVVLLSCCASSYAQEGGAVAGVLGCITSLPEPANFQSLGGFIECPGLPIYPEPALRAGIQGTVVLYVTLDRAGIVEASEAVEGDPLLVAACIDALRDYRFNPFIFYSSPHKAQGQMRFRFWIEGAGEQVRGRVKDLTWEPYFNSPDMALYRSNFANFGPSETIGGQKDSKPTPVPTPSLISGAAPELPPELNGKSGSVYLVVTIGADGRVASVKVSGGVEPFVAPVVSAVRHFVYEPTLVNGHPAAVSTNMSYHFGQYCRQSLPESALVPSPENVQITQARPMPCSGR